MIVLRTLIALLLMLEPLNFALRLLQVLPTITYRGWITGVELAVHGAIAAFCSAAAIALWNGADGSRRIAAIAVVLSTARVLQTLYWSTLPSHTVPGDEPLYAAVAVLIAVPTLLVLRRAVP